MVSGDGHRAARQDDPPLRGERQGGAVSRCSPPHLRREASVKTAVRFLLGRDQVARIAVRDDGEKYRYTVLRVMSTSSATWATVGVSPRSRIARAAAMISAGSSLRTDPSGRFEGRVLTSRAQGFIYMSHVNERAPCECRGHRGECPCRAHWSYRPSRRRRRSR